MEPRFVSKSFFVSCAVSAVTVAATLLIPTAAAAESPTVSERTLGEVTAANQGVGAAAAGSITCTLKIDNPHQSSTFSDSWNVHAWWECRYDADNSRAYVDTLKVAPDLYRDGELVGNPPTKLKYNVYYLRANAAAKCIVGDWDSIWYGKAWGYVKFPPNYEPQEATLRVSSGNFLQGLSCAPPPAR